MKLTPSWTPAGMPRPASAVPTGSGGGVGSSLEAADAGPLGALPLQLVEVLGREQPRDPVPQLAGRLPGDACVDARAEGGWGISQDEGGDPEGPARRDRAMLGQHLFLDARIRRRGVDESGVETGGAEGLAQHRIVVQDIAALVVGGPPASV